MPDHGATSHRTASSPPGFTETARRIALYVWFEERLFEILGGWVTDVPEPEVKVLLATQSRHHAWRAGLWRELAPLRHELLPAEPGPAAVELMAALSTSATTLEKLVAAHRVAVPSIVAAYERHAETLSAVADAPVARVLRIVLADAREDLRSGETVLQVMLGSAEAARGASIQQEKLEMLLARAGGIEGLSRGFAT